MSLFNYLRRALEPRLRRGAIVFTVTVLVTLISTITRAEIVDRVVAVVNDTVITLSELNAAYVIGQEASGQRPEPMTTATASETLDALIEQKLIKQGADRIGIDVSEKDVDRAVDDVIRQNRLTKARFIVALSRTGLTYNEYRSQIEEQIRQIKFINKMFRSMVVVEETDMEEYYTQNSETFYKPDALRLRIINLSNRDEDLMNTRLKLVLKGLKEGVDFSELAVKYSQSPTAPRGGDLGYVTAKEMDAKMAQAALKLKLGEVSPPLYSKRGVTLLQLVDTRKGEPVPFEDVKDSIHDRLFKKFLNDNFNYWIKDIKNVAHIEVRL